MCSNVERVDSPSVSVVIPARNEETLLPAALAAVDAARRQSPDLAVDVIVVADACSDRTAQVAVSFGAHVLEIAAGNVGAARAAGIAAALDRSRPSAGMHWLASTDADSQVPPHWLTAQVTAAQHGCQLFLGTVKLAPEVEDRFPRWVRQYTHDATQGHEHGHVHGANLGIEASTYLAIGGFRPMATGEDVDLAQRARHRGAQVAWCTDAPVTTSARMHARAPDGVSCDLART